MLFHRSHAEFSDGIIDLIPLHVNPPAKELGFGHEQVWRITLHNQRQEIGQISYRDGESRCVYYYGHIGYHIDSGYRGNHFARRACSLIRGEIAGGGKRSVIITCDPDNTPSRMTCEHLGCVFESIVHVPEDILKKYDINSVKCRYVWITESDGECDDG